MKRLFLLVPVLWIAPQSAAAPNEFRSILSEQCSQNDFFVSYKTCESNFRYREGKTISRAELLVKTFLRPDLASNLEIHKEVIGRVLVRSGETDGAIEHPGENDYFLIDKSIAEIIIISLEAGSNLYPMLEVIDADGRIVSKPHAHDSSVFEMHMLKLNALTGPLKLRVKAQNDRTGKYKLKHNFASVSGLKGDVIRLTNSERMQRGLADLNYNHLLESAAQFHADDMKISGRYLGHSGSNGSSPGDRIRMTGYKAAWHDNGDGSLMYIRQENVASGQLSPASVVKSWMNSPPHRAAMLSPEAKEIGIGFEIDAKTGASYWVQTFGIPWRSGDKSFF